MTLCHLGANPLNVTGFFYLGSLSTAESGVCLKNTLYSKLTIINIAITFVMNLVTLVLAHTIFICGLRKQGYGNSDTVDNNNDESMVTNISTIVPLK